MFLNVQVMYSVLLICIQVNRYQMKRFWSFRRKFLLFLPIDTNIYRPHLNLILQMYTSYLYSCSGLFLFFKCLRLSEARLT
jgi:hypothetical protein